MHNQYPTLLERLHRETAPIVLVWVDQLRLVLTATFFEMNQTTFNVPLRGPRRDRPGEFADGSKKEIILAALGRYTKERSVLIQVRGEGFATRARRDVLKGLDLLKELPVLQPREELRVMLLGINRACA